MPSRRDALQVLAAGALAPALRAQHNHTEMPAPATPPRPRNLSTEDMELLAQLTDAIIPRTTTPGASDAGVPLYIDRKIETRHGLRKQLDEGLAKLRASGFQTASPETRVAMLREMETASDPFFTLIKNLTIDGYYSSKPGLVGELGYHGNTYLTEFPGCTHPEHQVSTDGN